MWLPQSAFCFTTLLFVGHEDAANASVTQVAALDEEINIRLVMLQDGLDRFTLPAHVGQSVGFLSRRRPE